MTAATLTLSPLSTVARLVTTPRGWKRRTDAERRTRKTWDAMLRRCLDPKHPHFKRYGGRGITVCERWRTYDLFVADMGLRPAGMTLDRVDNTRCYEPGNCRWASWKRQARNKSNNTLRTHAGQTMTLAEWSEVSGVKYTTLRERLRRGWTLEDAIRIPALPHGHRHVELDDAARCLSIARTVAGRSGHHSDSTWSRHYAERLRMLKEEASSRDGLCACGCERKTRIAVHTRLKSGAVAGHPHRFIRGHEVGRIRASGRRVRIRKSAQ